MDIKFGELLQEYRLNCAKISRKEFAAELGFTPSKLAMIEQSYIDWDRDVKWFPVLSNHVYLTINDPLEAKSILKDLYITWKNPFEAEKNKG